MATKDELLKQLKDLGVTGDPKATNADLEGLLYEVREQQAARHEELTDSDGFGAYPGDVVRYVLDEGHADMLTKREERFARSVKGTAPFNPRAYAEGDGINATVHSAYDDGTATLDLAGIVPRVTIDRAPLGDGPGHYQKRD